MSKPIVIIGAGLAGMNAALEIQRAGREVVLLEASDRAGGRVKSDVIDGFTCDHGFQLINAKYPELARLQLVSKLDFRFSPKVVNIVYNGKIHKLGDPRKYPLSIFDKTTGSLLEKSGLLMALTHRPSSEISIADYLIRCGLGRTYSRVLKPFLRGVYLTELENICAPVGMQIIRSFISGQPGLPAGGVGKLADEMASQILDLRLGVTVNSISSGLVKSSIGDLKASEIIVATDSTSAAQLLDFQATPKLASCTTWYHCSNTAPIAHGDLILDGENDHPVINTLVISNFIKEYAPVGKHLISSTTNLGVTESEVRRHLAKLYQTQNRDWDLIAKYEIPAALPIGAKNISQPIQSYLREGIYLAGDAQVAPTQNGALKSGRLAAASVLALQSFV